MLSLVTVIYVAHMEHQMQQSVIRHFLSSGKETFLVCFTKNIL